jgi:hypothetical protein
LTVKEILAKYQLPEDQAAAIIKGLKIDKKNTEVLGPKQLAATEKVCQLIKEGVPLVDALVQALDEARQESGAIALSDDLAVAIAPPISGQTVVSLEDYAKEVIPPDATRQFVSGALDGVDDMADQLSPGNGYQFGQTIAQKIVRELPNHEEEIQKEIQARLGERKARVSA